LVSIIIVNYNTSKVLRDCINSIFKFENAQTFEIIIIDNFSADDSKEVINRLAKEYNNIKPIFLEKLESFSFANNRGIEISSGEYILIMNPDIIFTEPLLEKLLMDFNDDKSIGAITPALVGTDGKFQRNYFQRYPTIMQFLLFHSIYAKIFFHFPKLMNRWLENQDVDINQKKIWYVEQIPCAFFMAKKTMFQETGFMDENYVLFFEDVDLSYQINKKYKLAIDSSLSVTHLGGSSFGTPKSDTDWWMYGRFIASMVYFFGKNYSSARKFLLKFFAASNSITIILIEYAKMLIGRADKYRIKKHKNLLKLLF
jgi:N-acetylglucosaminyl-diphospho-decaprenol L-rhamnosyltransferase